MKVIQVYQTNPFENGQGGGVRYVKNLINGITKDIDEILFLGIGEKKTTNGKIKLLPITRSLTGYAYFLFVLMIRLPFINLKEYEVVHVHRLYFAIPFILLKPRLKIVCTLHGRTFSVFESRHGNGKMILVKPLFQLIEKFSINRIDYLVPVSLDVLNHFKNKYSFITAKSLSIIGSMFSFNGFKLQSSDFLSSRFGKYNKYVLFIGRIEEVKNIDFLIHLWEKKFQQDNSVKLIIAGEGGLGIKMRDWVSSLNLKNAPVFLGEVIADNIPNLISSANMCVLCSHHEASPTVVKESLACGKPLVSNAIGDVEEFIINGKNGFVVDKNFDDYHEAIRRLLNKPIQESEVRDNSASALLNCTIENITQKYVSVYKSVIK